MTRENSANKKYRSGFTLIELLIVMAILAIIVGIGLGFYSNVQPKARDAKRKNDLSQVAKALELYYQDRGTYPASSGGQISGCGAAGTAVCTWGGAFVNETNSTVYMAQLPREPRTGYTYFYESSGTAYQIYARLENIKDPDVPYNGTTPQVYSGSACGGDNCNYAIGSTNTLTYRAKVAD